MPPRLNEFRDITGGIDFSAWRSDIIARLMEEPDTGISTRELSREYYGDEDLVSLISIGQQMQAVRGMLHERNLLLLNSSRRWYLVPPGDSARARQFIVERTRRMLRAYAHLGRFVGIGRETYELPDTDTLLQAIEGNAPSIAQLREALDSDDDP